MLFCCPSGLFLCWKCQCQNRINHHSPIQNRLFTDHQFLCLLDLPAPRLRTFLLHTNCIISQLMTQNHSYFQLLANPLDNRRGQKLLTKGFAIPDRTPGFDILLYNNPYSINRSKTGSGTISNPGRPCKYFSFRLPLNTHRAPACPVTDSVIINGFYFFS